MPTLQIPATGLVAQPAVDAVRDQFLAVTYGVVDADQVEFSVDPVQSEFRLRSKEIAGDGTPGKFIGSFSVPYEKVRIETCLPYPVFLDIPYPANFSLIRKALLEQYSVVFEEYELALTPNGPALANSDYVDVMADPANMIELYVSSLSGRFVANDPVRFYVASVQGAKSLNLTFRQVGRPETASLLDNKNSQGTATIFDSTDQEMVLEMMKEHFGSPIPDDSCAVTTKSLNYNTSVAFLRPHDGSSQWRGFTEFQFDKSLISEALPDTLVVNTNYPTEFKNLQSYLKNTYGLTLPDGEFAMMHPKQPPLRFDSIVDAPLDEFGFLQLYVTRNSIRWRGRDRLTLQFLKSVADLTHDVFAGSPPSENSVYEGFTYSYPGAAANPGTTYTVVRGTPPAPLSEDGTYSGDIVQSGMYIWTVCARNSTGVISLQTEQLTQLP